jgi:hypothetical protein
LNSYNETEVSAFCLLQSAFLLGFFFYPEVVCDMFLRNSFSQEFTQQYFPEDGTLHHHRREIVKL